MLVLRLESYVNEVGVYSLVEERVVATGLTLADAQAIEALWNYQTKPQPPTPADLQHQAAVDWELNELTRSCTPENPCEDCQAWIA